MTHGSGLCWLAILLCGGCAAQGDRLPPLPAEWPLNGVVVEPVDAPPGELLPPQGVPHDPTCHPLALCPTCLTPGSVPFSPSGPLLSNPIFVPIVHREAAWEAIVNVIDDYFRIAEEERVRAVGHVLTEGRIVTYPQIGATLLEPHRPDSVGGYNRLLATFQTIRRIAQLRVVPTEGGYQIGVVVEVQMEDLPYPEHATASAALFHGHAPLLREEYLEPRIFLTGVWYPIGRDTALEQQILSEIRSCLDVGPPGAVY